MGDGRGVFDEERVSEGVEMTRVGSGGGGGSRCLGQWGDRQEVHYGKGVKTSVIGRMGTPVTLWDLMLRPLRCLNE